MILPITDDTPELGVIGFAERKGMNTGNVSMIIYMNTILLAAMTIVFLYQLLEVGVIYSLLAVAVLTPVSIYSHFQYYKKQILQIRQKIEINFPKKVPATQVK